MIANISFYKLAFLLKNPPQFLISLVSVRVLGVQRGVSLFRHALTAKLVARKARSVWVLQRCPVKKQFVTFSVCFFFCVLCFLKDTVLAGVSRRFRVARPIRTDRCLRRTLRLVIRPRSVASVSGAGTLTSCRGAIGLLPRQVHGRIRCRGR